MSSGQLYVVRARHANEEDNPATLELSAEFFRAAQIQGMLLKQAKSGLDRMQPAAKNRLLGALHQPGKTVVRCISRETRAQGMSNAWLKGYELYDFFDIHVLRAKGVFFNAELPGSFLAALNHWFAERDRSMIPWLASSLHPNCDSSALGDIYGLWKGNPDKWIMTKENAGDLRTVLGVRSIIKTVKDHNLEVEMYVADGGIEFDPDQEAAGARMQLGQVLCCLRLLNAGGMAIMKFYTYFHPWTSSMIAFLADNCFTNSYMVKPIMSRITNSEVYFVGTGFLGCPRDELMRVMLGAFLQERVPINMSCLAAELSSLQSETFDALYRIMFEIYGQQQRHLTRIIQAPPHGRLIPPVRWTRFGPRPIDPRHHLPQKEACQPCSQQFSHILPSEEGPTFPTEQGRSR